MTCKHCEQWTRDGCRFGHRVFPNGNPGNCRDYWRQPGSDDDVGESEAAADARPRQKS